MALETLKGVTEFGGFSVVDMNSLRDKRPDMFRPDGSMHYHLFERDIRPTNFVYVRDDVNSISFTMQKGPVKEVGINGCQVDTLIYAARRMIDGLNKQFPCRENVLAVTKLDEALHWLEARKLDREKRGVEGENKA